jgi:hypothetical protein
MLTSGWSLYIKDKLLTAVTICIGKVFELADDMVEKQNYHIQLDHLCT